MAMTTRKTLTRADWARAGLVALTTEGPDAVAIEPIAATLGATKGSGYWHFANRQGLLRAVMDLWKQTHTIDVIAQVENAGGTPRQRLVRLVNIVSTAALESPAELLVLGSRDPTVRATVEESVMARVRYVERLLREAGVARSEARSRAVLAYSAYLGHVTLAATTPQALPRSAAARRRMQHGIMRLALVEDDLSPSTEPE
jgi:AcrR family transcriptional regulator